MVNVPKNGQVASTSAATSVSRALPLGLKKRIIVHLLLLHTDDSLY